MAACAVYVVSAILMDWRLYVIDFIQYAPLFVLSGPIIGFFGLAGAGVATRPRAPLTFVREKLRERWVAVVCIMLVYWAGMSAFWTFKFHIPDLVPFFADPALAALDEAIHFGVPWRALHDVIPAAAARILVIVYYPIWIAQFIGILTLSAFLRNPILRTRYFASFAMMIVGLGNILAAALSSVGPIFYERVTGNDRFAELTDILRGNESYAFVIQMAERLYSSFATGTGGVFAGISAMPSIHVAVPALNAMLLAKLDRRLGYVGWTFTALIVAESVYFGWHYAVDGYVSVAAVWLIWHAAGRLVGAESSRVAASSLTNEKTLGSASATPRAS